MFGHTTLDGKYVVTTPYTPDTLQKPKILNIIIIY